MKTPTRIYISGPMTGMPEKNFPAFNAEAKRLRDLGYEVVNPVDINGEAAVKEGRSHIECLRNDIAGLATCDTVALLPLPAHIHSLGMHIEVQVAELLQLQIVRASSIVSSRYAAVTAVERLKGWISPDTEPLAAMLADAPDARDRVRSMLNMLDAIEDIDDPLYGKNRPKA